ncbi:unnamed protein product [Rhizopus stolonifer]
MFESKRTIASLPNIESLEDGPLFRATLQHLESRTSILKTRLKRMMKLASASLEARKQSAKSDQELMESLCEIECVDPLTSHYLEDAWSKIAKERQKLDTALISELIDPIKTLYENDVKAAESMKRKFDDESKSYDSVLAKYLKKQKQVNEEKQLTRKLKYDLARFDYLSYLTDLHGGRKEHDILSHITNYAVGELNHFDIVSEKVATSKPGLELLSVLLSENSDEFSIRMNERYKKRRDIEKAFLGMDNKKRSSVPDSANSACSTTSSSIETSTTTENKFKSIRDLEERQKKNVVLMGRKKEGLLFATSKASKSSGFEVKAPAQSWNIYWCVLSGGQLYEYSNWKRQLEPHNGPIDLRLATVREARNIDRRFCFEVITPHLKRTYQATSQEEADQWISTIQNSIESVLNGTSSSANFKTLISAAPTVTKKKHLGRPLRSLSVLLKSVAAPDKQSTDIPSGPLTQEDNTRSWSCSASDQTITKPANQAQSPITSKELINTLRSDESNHVCADCDAKDPDWCSLNLGILLCIGK